MKEIKFSKIFLVLVVLVCLSACKTTKDYIYMQDVVAGQPYAFNHHDPVVHAGDKLSITVSCKNPELAMPFNSNGGVVTLNANGGIMETSAQARSASYRVDSNGYIEFPILGTLKVDGLTASGVQELIKTKIVEGQYISNPLVTMEFQNFKYTVLGAVGANGSYGSESGRVTLLEAIASAGDLAENANTKRILVFREENGHEIMYEHDITSSDFLKSPCYFLQQNDLVYVEPKQKSRNVGERTFRMATIALSSLSTIATTLWVVLRLTE